jgi:hypothetical protein
VTFPAATGFLEAARAHAPDRYLRLTDCLYILRNSIEGESYRGKRLLGGKQIMLNLFYQFRRKASLILKAYMS